MQQRSEERPGGALKHDRFFGPWPCASTRPMAWPNRLSLCESSIFFVSFATFCPNSERIVLARHAGGQQALRPNSKESPPR